MQELNAPTNHCSCAESCYMRTILLTPADVLLPAPSPHPTTHLQIDLPKALATKPLERCVGIPLDDLPPAIANALASFCSSVSDAGGQLSG